MAALRRAMSSTATLASADADALLRVHASTRVQDTAWADFFVEMLTDYVVRELEPSGYVTAAHAGWLIARISSGGRVRTKTELDLLLNVIDKARWAPQCLVTFALAQVREAVETGAGPLRSSGEHAPRTIVPAEIDYLRAVLFAAGCDGLSALTAAELTVLLEIDLALRRADGDLFRDAPADWADLMKKSVANAILAISGYGAPSREEALRAGLALSRRGETHEPRLAVVGDGGAEVLACYRQRTSEAMALERLERQRIEIITGEPVGGLSAAWLAERLERTSAETRALPALLDASGFMIDAAFAPGRQTSGQAA